VATLYDGYGRRRYTGPMSDFEMIWQDAGTLVIKAKDPGLFTELGFRPVAFEIGAAAELEAGMEVAQVDWDGRTTRVDWTTIQEVAVEGGDPTLVLADGVLPGASGGGVFRLGAHIGNNRSLVEELNAAGGLIDAHSIVALNGGYFR
jgi:hypothetical protein